MSDIMQFLKNILDKIDNYRENGGAGSGNWGHAGRKGKLGGSAPTNQGTPTEHEAARRQYGRRLRELAETYGAANVGKTIKAKIAKQQEKERAQDAESRFKEISGKRIDDPTKYKPSRISKGREKDYEKAVDPNYKPEFKTLVTTPKGAKLIEKDGKVAWVQSRMIRADGTLTPKGQEALKYGQTSEEYNAKQKAIAQRQEEKAEIIKNITNDIGWNKEADKSPSQFIKMKEDLALKNPQAFQAVKDKTFKIPDAVVEILNNDRTAVFTPNYWQTPDGSKKRIYYNVSNLKGWKYPLAEKFIEL